MFIITVITYLKVRRLGNFSSFISKKELNWQGHVCIRSHVSVNLPQGCINKQVGKASLPPSLSPSLAVYQVTFIVQIYGLAE